MGSRANVANYFGVFNSWTEMNIPAVAQPNACTQMVLVPAD